MSVGFIDDLAHELGTHLRDPSADVAVAVVAGQLLRRAYALYDDVAVSGGQYATQQLRDIIARGVGRVPARRRTRRAGL